MNDLDYDELDKAVNSLVSSGPVPVDHSLTEDKTIDFDKKTDHPSIVGQTAPRLVKPTVSPMVTGNVGGRYMDVVPPTLKGRAKPLTEKPVSRQGVTIASSSQNLPSSSPVTQPMPQPLVDNTAPLVSGNAPIQSPTPIQPVAPSSIAMPDPVDLVKNDNPIVAAPTNAESDSEDADIDQISNDINATLNQAASSSPDSPFLSGAKVDKRPLGAFSADEPNQPKPIEIGESADTTDKAVTVVKENDSKQDATMTKEVNSITPLPAELSNDLLSIESNAVMPGDVNSAEQSRPVDNHVESSIVKPAPSKEPSEESSVNANMPKGDVAVASDTPTAKPKESANQSDASAYSQHPSADGQTISGAVYDTNSYNNNLLHPAKKKSGVMMIVWIVLLLVVGAASGAAIYYFVLPQMTL
jgi:hypothetical protein